MVQWGLVCGWAATRAQLSMRAVLLACTHEHEKTKPEAAEMAARWRRQVLGNWRLVGGDRCRLPTSWELGRVASQGLAECVANPVSIKIGK